MDAHSEGPVIPAKAGIQKVGDVTHTIDFFSRLPSEATIIHRGDGQRNPNIMLR